MKLGFLKIGEKWIEKLGFRICACEERRKGTSGRWRREPTLETRERERDEERERETNRENKFSIQLSQIWRRKKKFIYRKKWSKWLLRVYENKILFWIDGEIITLQHILFLLSFRLTYVLPTLLLNLSLFLFFFFFILKFIFILLTIIIYYY